MDDKKCPWCDKGVYCPMWPDRATTVPCGYCKGTGLYSEWIKHPEYARQLADERLTKFRVIFP